MVMGERGMADMTEMTMPLPDNTIPMMTRWGPYGSVEMGGMFSMLKVRADQKPGDYSDPGWFQHRQVIRPSNIRVSCQKSQKDQAPQTVSWTSMRRLEKINLGNQTKRWAEVELTVISEGLASRHIPIGFYGDVRQVVFSWIYGYC